MVECPADGCSYTSPTKQGVLGHCTGKRDDVHKGGWKHWESVMDGSGSGSASDPSSSSSSTDTTGDENASDSSQSGSSSGGGSHPAQDVPPTENRNTGVSGDGGDGVQLPCGHESYDPSEAPDPPFRVSCGECGTAWKVTE